PMLRYTNGVATARSSLHADERGSILATADSSGNLFSTNHYDEYGRPGPWNHGRFGYTGQMWLPESGLFYYKARMYNPGPAAGGRFMQADPIGYGDGPNMYAYVGNDPINRSDPSGRCGWQIVSWLNTYARWEDGTEKPVKSVPRYGVTECSDNDIVVTGLRVKRGGSVPTLSLLAAPSWDGPAFCSNPTLSEKTNRFFPNGRITTVRQGGIERAIFDMTAIALANGLAPLASVFGTGQRARYEAALSAPSPTPVGNGWYAWTNPVSRMTIVGTFLLELRFNSERRIVNLDIPAGFLLPNGERLTMTETCHYTEPPE
ncbi:RHS repeat-associated core domain-containing protein, partial [Allosphingosinicella sp.]|uniref:RHS repeat-associated core domain-containing protein n=1 Tax=Allosphingosinicella sp. TaxID=2823234 RepID=UPI002EE9678F